MRPTHHHKKRDRTAWSKIYTFKNRERIREQSKKYRLKNRELIKKSRRNRYLKNHLAILISHDLYYLMNKEKVKKRAIALYNTYRKYKPWMITYHAIQQRCNDRKRKDYKRYGARGIKNFLSTNDVKVLYLRDNASKMTCPSIDRIDSNKSYTLDNCRFIEHVKNCRRLKI